jgi:hypothetical protein
MAGSQHLLAIAMAFISAGVPGGSGSKLEAVGVIVEANHASLSGHSASEGTTIFDGDQMSTEAEGSLDLQIGQAVFHLADRSSAVMHDILHDSASNSVRQFDVELLSVTAANSGGIAACGARIQPIPQTRGIVRVQIAGPHELVIYAKRGAAQISYRGETENIEEGKTYRVRLSADDEGGQGGAITKSSGHSSKLLLVVAVVVGAATAIAAGQAASGKQGSLESPDHP